MIDKSWNDILRRIVIVKCNETFVVRISITPKQKRTRLRIFLQIALKSRFLVLYLVTEHAVIFVSHYSKSLSLIIFELNESKNLKHEH